VEKKSLHLSVFGYGTRIQHLAVFVFDVNIASILQNVAESRVFQDVSPALLAALVVLVQALLEGELLLVGPVVLGAGAAELVTGIRSHRFHLHKVRFVLFPVVALVAQLLQPQKPRDCARLCQLVREEIVFVVFIVK